MQINCPFNLGQTVVAVVNSGFPQLGEITRIQTDTWPANQSPAHTDFSYTLAMVDGDRVEKPGHLVFKDFEAYIEAAKRRIV